jgi:hypothetical protein
MDEIDKFRENFFDKVIEAEKRKAQEEKRKQATCFHKYEQVEQNTQSEYQYRVCSKCGHSALKRVNVWEGTKRCIIQ